MDQQLSDIDQKLNDIKKILLRDREQPFNKLYKEAIFILTFICLAVIITVFLSVAYHIIPYDGAAVFLAAISTLLTAFSFFFVALITVKQNEDKNG